MRTTPPTRLPADVYDSAVAEHESASRTVPQQIAHWARIGRELERSPQVNHRAIQAVLAGDSSYDGLAEREQAVVRATWDEQIADDIAALDFEKEFRETGDSWVIGDGQGGAVNKHA